MGEVRRETLTIVFTDIEDSTVIARRLGDHKWASTFAQHADEVAALANQHGGRIVKSLGDGFMLSFSSAGAGLRCALAIVGSSLFRVRAGIHVGETTFTEDGDLSGVAVVKAARLSAAATGGELLASDIVRSLTQDDAVEVRFGPAQVMELKGLLGTHVAYRAELLRESGEDLRVVIADDAVIVRDGLAALLGAGGISVAAVASDATNLPQLVELHRPGLVITDVRMPPTHTDEGLVAVEQIRSSDPSMPVLVLSQHPDPSLAVRLLASSLSSGSGYLLKDRVTDLDILLDAVRRIRAGGIVLDEELVTRMVRRRTRALTDLAQPERVILSRLAEGHAEPAIAAATGRSPDAVSAGVAAVLAALGLEASLTGQERVRAIVGQLAG